VEAPGVIEAFDVGEQVASRLVSGSVDAVVGPLDLQGVEEALHRGVVEAVTFA